MTKIEYLDKIESYIFSVYNCYSKFRYIFYRNKKILKKNFELKKKGKNVCFILGNGPSLCENDLKKIKNETIFTVNFFHKSMLSNIIRPTYHVMIDEAFYDEDFDYLKKLYDNLDKTIFLFRTNAYEKLKSEISTLKRAYFIYAKLMQNGDYLSLDMTKNTTACVNVVISCIQSAIYMGYKEIYLLGCDFNSYTSERNKPPEHFYSKETEDENLELSQVLSSMGSDLRYSALAHYHHYALNTYAKKNGIKIINLTPNSLIDAYPKGNLDEILNLEKLS